MTRTYCIAAVLFAATIASSCKRDRRSDEVDNTDRTYQMPTETPASSTTRPEQERERPRPRLDDVPSQPAAAAPQAPPPANPTALENLGYDERARAPGAVSAAGATGAVGVGLDAGVAPGVPMAPGDAGVGGVRDAGGVRDGGGAPRDAGGMRDGGGMRGDGGAGGTGTTGGTDTSGAPLVDDNRTEPDVPETTGNPSGDTTNPPSP